MNRFEGRKLLPDSVIILLGVWRTKGRGFLPVAIYYIRELKTDVRGFGVTGLEQGIRVKIL